MHVSLWRSIVRHVHWLQQNTSIYIIQVRRERWFSVLLLHWFSCMMQSNYLFVAGVSRLRLQQTKEVLSASDCKKKITLLPCIMEGTVGTLQVAAGNWSVAAFWHELILLASIFRGNSRDRFEIDEAHWASNRETKPRSYWQEDPILTEIKSIAIGIRCGFHILFYFTVNESAHTLLWMRTPQCRWKFSGGLTDGPGPPGSFEIRSPDSRTSVAPTGSGWLKV